MQIILSFFLNLVDDRLIIARIMSDYITDKTEEYDRFGYSIYPLIA